MRSDIRILQAFASSENIFGDESTPGPSGGVGKTANDWLRESRTSNGCPWNTYIRVPDIAREYPDSTLILGLP